MLAHKATHEGKVAAEVIAGQERRLRPARDPLGRLHRPRGRVDRPDRDRGEGRGHRVREGASSRGRRRAGRSRSAAPEGLTKLLVDPETAAGARRRHRRPERRRADRRGRRSRSRWAPTPRTSASRSTRTRPSRRRSVFAAEMAEGTITDLYAAEAPAWLRRPEEAARRAASRSSSRASSRRRTPAGSRSRRRRCPTSTSRRRPNSMTRAWAPPSTWSERARERWLTSRA